jgi:hypothetical protein
VDPKSKKARGVYYSPTHMVDYIVKHTVGQLLTASTPKQAAKLRILDPACGSGLVLVGAYQCLLDWHQIAGGGRLTPPEKKRILLDNIFGVDIDPQAVEATKFSLLGLMLEGDLHENGVPDLGSNIKCGNSLIGPDFDGPECHRMIAFDWSRAFPHVLKAGGFDAVIGNPPWGQKAVDPDPAVKQYLWTRFPSSRGIHDVFRPFVELGISLLREDGMFGFVLPDIVLLKNYPETRRYLLEQLALTRIDWWGRAFHSAVIDAVTILGTKKAAPKEHRVWATVRDPDQPVDHEIPQGDFWANPRLAFNLFLTPEKRQTLELLKVCPQLGGFFEIHEGVHSGNIRQELFVSAKMDSTCRELYFGRGEIVPYHLQWQGKFIRLAALPEIKSRERYANPGKATWHEREKVLVRRTGDYVLAAVDSCHRYASNNFFLVFPRQPCSLDLHGLCALLNSRLMTWYYRTIEPRRGRVFAELKIKHLTSFPLPIAILTGNGCKELNELGAKRAGLAASRLRAAKAVASAIDVLVCDLFGLAAAFEEVSGGERHNHATARKLLSRHKKTQATSRIE